MTNYTKFFLSLFSSLRFTVVVLSVLFVLVFLMTLDQVSLGIFLAKKKYFESWIVMQPIGSLSIPILPGGLTIGLLLVVGLTVTPFYKYKLKKEKLGIWMIHIGLIFLIIGSYLIQRMAVESQMAVREGETVRFSQSRDHFELILARQAGSNTESLVVLPERFLFDEASVDLESLDLRLDVLNFMSNSEIRLSSVVEPDITKGIGRRLNYRKLPWDGTMDGLNNPTAVIELFDTRQTPHQSLGKWLVSTLIDRAQLLSIDNVTYGIQLRPKRYYHPFALTLIDFRHDVYAGTDVPKNFSSDVRVLHDDGDVFDYKIYMNHPLRYAGLTFYQASYGENNKLTVLQIVKNSVWWFPYVSSGIISLGLFLHLILMIQQRLKMR